jgi:hypothetical protein
MRPILSRFTYPERVHHDNMHHRHHHYDHHHYDHPALAHFLGFYAVHNPHGGHDHHHRDTTFNKLIVEWRSIEAGIFQAFADFRDRVERKVKDKADADKNKAKVEAEKKAAVQKEKDKWEEKMKEAKDREKKLEKQVEDEEDRQMQLRQRRERHEQHLEDDVHEMAHGRLTQDPAEALTKVVDVMDKIKSKISPSKENNNNGDASSSDEEDDWWCDACQGYHGSHHYHHHHGHNHHRHHGHGHGRCALCHSHSVPAAFGGTLGAIGGGASANNRLPPIINQIQVNGPEVEMMEEAVATAGGNSGAAANNKKAAVKEGVTLVPFEVVSASSVSSPSPSTSVDDMTIFDGHGTAVHLGRHAHHGGHHGRHIGHIDPPAATGGHLEWVPNYAEPHHVRQRVYFDNQGSRFTR